MHLKYIISNMNKIIEFVKTCESNPLIPLSWGIRNISVGGERISFFVNGSRYQGKVVIENEMGCLKIVIGDSKKKFIYAIEAFSWLDQHIE